MIKLYGLIGNPLTHSFSKEYFSRKFQLENISNCQYQLFPLKSMAGFQNLITDHNNLLGLNVTIPFKKEVLNYLDHLSPEAAEAGAVNCLKIDRSSGNPYLTGHNTDIYGFEQSLKPLLKARHRKALILGTGGSSAAVAFVLKSLDVDFYSISRKPQKRDQIKYDSLTREIIREHLLIINATPVGMFPNTSQFPDIPYEWITPKHLLFDLVYNPAETFFLKKGKEKGAITKNGRQMLHLQAEKSWEIWQQ
jgi:shikimate dehydrogenase